MNKQMLVELKKRLLNRGTLTALAAFVIGKLITLGYIDVAMGDGLRTLVDAALNVAVVGGFLNNAGLGKGFKDN